MARLILFWIAIAATVGYCVYLIDRTKNDYTHEYIKRQSQPLTKPKRLMPYI